MMEHIRTNDFAHGARGAKLRRKELAKAAFPEGFNILTCDTARSTCDEAEGGGDDLGMFKEEQSEIDAAYSNEAAGAERVAAVEALLLQSSRRHRDFIERHTQPHKRPPTNMAMVRGSLAGRRSESRNMRNRQDRDAMERERRQLLERLEAIEREERRERERQQNFDGGAELEQRAKEQGFKIRKHRFAQSM